MMVRRVKTRVHHEKLGYPVWLAADTMEAQKAMIQAI